jgi:long-chain fatty acid transport protein
MKKKRTIWLALLLFVGLNSLASANGFNLNSLGTRALAMGGAFVGLADDFSAIFWNPAGVAQFKTKSLGFYFTDILPSGSYLLQVPTEAGLLTVVDAKTKTKHYLSGMAAYYQPLNKSLVAGIGVYIPSGLGSVWKGEQFIGLQDYELDLPPGQHSSSYLWESRIGMVTIAPVVSYKVNDMLSIGATLNINYGMFTLKRWAGGAAIPQPPYALDLGQYENSLNGWGVGATFGVLYKPNKKLSFGATVRTPSKLSLSGNISIQNIDLLSSNFKNQSEASMSFTSPWWIAAGLALRPINDLTITADLQWTNWSKENVLETTFKDPFWSLFMEASGGNMMPLKWKNALQVRFGAEYMIYQNVALRAGYYYDPSPAPDKTMNVLLPVHDFNVITVGLGYDLNGLVIDFGFEAFFGKGREVDFAKWLLDPDYKTAMPGKYGMNIYVPNISISYKF